MKKVLGCRNKETTKVKCIYGDPIFISSLQFSDKIHVQADGTLVFYAATVMRIGSFALLKNEAVKEFESNFSNKLASKLSRLRKKSKNANFSQLEQAENSASYARLRKKVITNEKH